jgi:Putative beta-barrel porin-2, OmpL-like. bbp2
MNNNNRPAKKIIILLLLSPFFFMKGLLFSQSADSAGTAKKIDLAALKITGYVDAYYGYYTDSVGRGNYQKFSSVSPRSNEFGLNTAMITAEYDGDKVRGIATFHFGDISKSTWLTAYNAIMEAHAGVRLTKKIWIDAGFFRTHLGTEGFLPRDNFSSSVAVSTYYEPYYEAGVRLNYNPNDKLAITIYGLNGYNLYEDNNEKKSVGMLVTYALGDKGNIGYSNYIGDDSPLGDSVSHLRIYQNLFWNYQIKKIKIQIGGDYGLQQNSNISSKNKTATMYSGIASLKYQVKKKIAFYGRGEIFNDPQGFMSGIIIDKENKFTGLKLWGATLGAEYKPTENSFIRLEGRKLFMDKQQETFRWNEKNQSTRMEVSVNIGVSF